MHQICEIFFHPYVNVTVGYKYIYIYLVAHSGIDWTGLEKTDRKKYIECKATISKKKNLKLDKCISKSIVAKMYSIVALFHVFPRNVLFHSRRRKNFMETAAVRLEISKCHCGRLRLS